MTPNPAARGERVTVSGALGDADSVKLELHPVGDADSAAKESSDSARMRVWRFPAVYQLSDGQNAFAFVVSPTTPVGEYTLIATAFRGTRARPLIVPTLHDGFNVTRRELIKITRVHPAVIYPGSDTVTLHIEGEGFSPTADENVVIVKDHGAQPSCDQRQRPGCLSERIEAGGRELVVSHVLAAPLGSGTTWLWVQVGDQRSADSVKVTVAAADVHVPGAIAIVFVVLVFGAVAILVGRAPSAVKGRYKWLPVLFLDPETQSYSLSKFQFLMWTIAAVVAYAYLVLIKSIVRGDFTFADVPAGLPGILLISAGTSTLAVGIATNKGSKGAGDQNPSLSDFITTGGLVAEDRLQFFVWTIIGVAGFLFLTFTIPVASLDSLPAIPPSLLTLMGISAAGYLGGKLVRKAGPVISQIEVAVTPDFVLTVHGTALSVDATFSIDNQPLDGKLDPKQNPGGRPAKDLDDDQAGANMAKVLRLVIATPATAWNKGSHNLTITNPDGQKAVWSFSLP